MNVTDETEASNKMKQVIYILVISVIRFLFIERINGINVGTCLNIAKAR